jgi:hypothetical protein
MFDSINFIWKLIERDPWILVNPACPVKSFVENKQREFNWGQKLFMDRFLR